MKKLSLLSLVLTALGCSSTEKDLHKKEAAVQELVVFGEEDGWGADIRLSIVNIEIEKEAVIYTARSSYQGDTVGLIVSVPTAPTGEKGFSSGLVLQSLGQESDQLLHVLSKLYDVPVAPEATFVPDISVTYVDLHEFANAVSGTTTPKKEYEQRKLFFEGADEKEYAELYIDIHPEDRWIELKEKDFGYRGPLLGFLLQ